MTIVASKTILTAGELGALFYSSDEDESGN
jgi:hypothetical protein